MNIDDSSIIWLDEVLQSDDFMKEQPKYDDIVKLRVEIQVHSNNAHGKYGEPSSYDFSDRMRAYMYGIEMFLMATKLESMWELIKPGIIKTKMLAQESKDWKERAGKVEDLVMHLSTLLTAEEIESCMTQTEQWDYFVTNKVGGKTFVPKPRHKKYTDKKLKFYAENIDSAKVNKRTRSGKNGKRISCPNCFATSLVYHFSWVSVVCQGCDKWIPKQTWLVTDKLNELLDEQHDKI